MDEAEARRARVMASNARWRWIFAALALAVPLGLFALFGRQEGRLRALADHGRPATATLTRITSNDNGRYAEYSYDVDGQSYTHSVGQSEAPYRPGETFPIVYLPEDPSLSSPGNEYSKAHLAADVNLPFQHRLLLGLFAFFAGSAALCERALRRQRAGGPIRTGHRIAPETMGRVLAGIFLAIGLGVNLDPKVAAVQAAAFGSAPFGLPITLVVMIAEVVLFAPLFPVCSHLMRIVVAAQARGAWLTRTGVVLAVVEAEPEHRRSRNIVIAGAVYFVALMAGWIAFAAYRGV
jgi:uncharacterized protein DUF3592